MKSTEIVYSKGQVSPSFIDIKTGKRIPWKNRHNTISFDGTHAMALAFGGDNSLIPNRIGILFGNGNNITFPTIDRNQSWDNLVYDLYNKNADVQVQPFSFSPSFEKISRSGIGSSSSMSSQSASSSSSEDAPGWAVTFHAHSDSTTEGAIGAGSSSGSGSSSSLIFTTGMRIFQALLLNEKNGEYTILARVSLDNNGVYYTKPENFELAIDWTIKFF